MSGALEEAAALLATVQSKCIAYFSSLRHAITAQKTSDAATLAEVKQELSDVRYDVLLVLSPVLEIHYCSF